ncbi:DUF4321 domain-containing protein [Cellulosilyticum sp. I15G10I2]|uniref:DUF4321 domain-containing protein n=1 Tax=Cellulosilyticum sp. I15G10I2 TaxID=1892843 RepID=UPI00085CCF53|nr:DUF4321 domain-containing protein [Cellulosilyticum sp. I15G10I2]
MAINRSTNFWVLILCMLAGLTVGNFIGELCSSVSFLKWINYTGHFGLDNPVQIDLGVIWLSFQVKLNITLAAILGMIGSVLIYQKIK